MEAENEKASRIHQGLSLFYHWAAEKSLPALNLHKEQYLK